MKIPYFLLMIILFLVDAKDEHVGGPGEEALNKGTGKSKKIIKDKREIKQAPEKSNTIIKAERKKNKAPEKSKQIIKEEKKIKNTNIFRSSSTNNIIQCSKKTTKVTLAPGESASFQSPNYPEVYGRKSKCKWQFKSTEDITISCSDFNLEPPNKRGKCKDKLKIGSKTYCGTSTPFYEGGTTVKILFKSNKRKHFNGFSCTATSKSTPINPPPPTKPPPSASCTCGQANRATRIVGGVETEVNEYPWQAALVFFGSSTLICGGSVIGSKHILTAAHCTQNIRDYAIDYQVLVGAHSLSAPAFSELRLDPDFFIQHEDFDINFLGRNIPVNDISVIVLFQSISFTNSEVRPICLPTNDADAYDNVLATVSGWGALDYGSSDLADALREVNVPTMSNSECQGFYDVDSITENMLCAAFAEGGKDACQGDSGGPLFYNPGRGYTQIGIVSWGIGCAFAGNPGVYTRISKFLPWISSNTASSTTCPAAN